jgi:hypothetical protein
MRSLGSKQLGALIVTAVTISAAVSPASASAASIGGFGARPQSFNSNLATRSYFIVDARLGSRQHEAVVVTNYGAKRLVLDVDAVDGLTGATSGVVYANRGVRVHGAGAWVRPALDRVTVPSRSSVVVHFAVDVPQSAPPGDQVAGIAFEPAQATRSAGTFAVKVIVRTVIGIEFEVPGPATERMQISSIALAPLPGTSVPSAVVTLADVGRKLCQPHLAVTIKGQGAAKTATQALDTILPEDRIAFPFKWPGSLSDGRYAVTARSTSCGPPVVIHAFATYSHTGAPPSNQASANVGASRALAATPKDGVPWLYGLAGLAVLLATGARVWFARRRKSRRGLRPLPLG